MRLQVLRVLLVERALVLLGTKLSVASEDREAAFRIYRQSVFDRLDIFSSMVNSSSSLIDVAGIHVTYIQNGSLQK